MAHPALTTALTGVTNQHLFVKDYTAGTPSAFADTQWLGDLIDPSADFSRSVQELITSARTLKSLGSKSGSISFPTVIAPDNTRLATLLSRFNDAADLAALLIIGAEPGVGAKNYAVYGVFKVATMPNALSSDTHTFNFTLELSDSSTLTQAFNQTAWPSL